MIEIYCDGACKANGSEEGVGGWGVWAPSLGASGISLYGGSSPTTNNKMELLAAIKAYKLIALLDVASQKNITIFSDSMYVVNGITEWISGWKRKGWETSKGPVKNQDLWRELDALHLKYQAKFKWVKAHNGDPGNEKADYLSNLGAAGQSQDLDTFSSQLSIKEQNKTFLDTTKPVLLIVVPHEPFCSEDDLNLCGSIDRTQYSHVLKIGFSNSNKTPHWNLLGYTKSVNPVMKEFGVSVESCILTEGYLLNTASLESLQSQIAEKQPIHICGYHEYFIQSIATQLFSRGILVQLLQNNVKYKTKKSKDSLIFNFKEYFGTYSVLE